MTECGLYKEEKFQSEQRDKLLMILDTIIRGDEEVIYIAGVYALAFYEGMSPFKDQLDLHNRCLLSNIKYQCDKIIISLQEKRDLRKKELRKKEKLLRKMKDK